MTENKTKEYYKNEIIPPQTIKLSFDCYEFYKFIEMIEKYTTEIEFVFENKELTITFFDDSRIMCSKCTKQLDIPTAVKKMKFVVDVCDLKEVLKTRKKDKKELELIFDNSKKTIKIIKISDKLNSTITSDFNLLEGNLEKLDPQILLEIEYNSEASFLIKYLDDFFYESGKYSDIINISIDDNNNNKKNNGIVFNEVGYIGNSDYHIKAKYCNILKGKGKGSYPLSFLNVLKPLLSILDKEKYILMKIKNNYPIRLELDVDSLGFKIIIFLAPRVPR